VSPCINGRVQVPETRYAKTKDGLKLAYQVFGSGPNLIGIPTLLSSVQLSNALVRWIGRMERQSATPADVARQIEAILYLDGVDPSDITAPTLVVQVRGDRTVRSSSKTLSR
jgi:hypothetical protein